MISNSFQYQNFYFDRHQKDSRYILGCKIENAIQIIMRDSNFQGSVHLLIALAQLFNKEYLNKLSTYTFYITLLISQLTMLLVVIHKKILSLRLSNLLGVFINKISNFLTLSPQNKNQSGIQTTLLRFFISILYLTTVISVIALFLNKKNRSSIVPFLQKYLRFSFHVLIAFSIPFLLFSISQLSNRFIISELQKSLDIFNIICLCFIIYAVQSFSIDVGIQQNSQSIKRIYKCNNGFKQLGKILTIWALFMSSKLQIEQFFIYLILIFLHGSELSNLCRCRKYMNQNLQKIKEVICSIWIACLLVIIIAHMFPLKMVVDNLGSIFLTVNFLFYFSFAAYRDYKRSNLLIQGYKMIKTEDKAISFALELITYMKQSNHNETSIQRLFKSLFVQRHRNYCENVICICHNKRSFQNDQILVKIVAQNNLQEISQKFPHSFCLKFLLVGFKLKNCRKILNINHKINQLMQTKNLNNLSFQQKFIVLELKKYINDRFSQYKHIESHIKCENIFLQQSIKDKIHSLLNMIILEMANKHKLLMQDYYTLNSVQQFSLNINKLICEMQDVWVSVCQINSFNHQLFRLFIFYYQNVIPSNIQGKKIARQIMQKLDKLKHLKGFSKQIMNKYVYSRKSCVIQSNLQQSFGTVTNVSKYCFDVLGYRKEQIMNKDIHQIMPQFFVKNHKQSMNLLLQKCTDSQYRTQMGEFGYVDKLQTCFQGFFLMKILAGQNKLLFYSVLIRQNDNDYILLNSQKEIQGIGKRLIKEDVLTSQNIKHSFNQYCDFNFDKKTLINQKFRGKIFLQNTLKKTIFKSIQGITSLQKLNKSKCKYQCMVNISKHFICKQFYYMIKFQNITKWVSSLDQFQQMRIDPKRQKNNKLPFSLKMIDGELMEIQQNESVQPVTNNIRFTQLLNLSLKNSSLASNGLNEVAYYNHFIKNVKKVVIDPTLLPLNYFKKLTILLLVLSACMMAQFFSLRKLFVVGFNSFNDVMFGDGAVSDNNQVLQIMYNHALMSRVYCQKQRESARCNYLLNSTATISDILYNMYLDNVKVYLQNRTALSGLKFYASYGIKVPYYFGNSNKIDEITTMQFMQYYYGAVRKVCDQISAGRVNSIEVDAAMNVLFKNWETMKFINHNAIYFYLSAGQYELNLLRDYLLFLGAALVICIFTFGICLKRYDNAVVRQKINIISIHTCMGKQLLRELTDYYTYIKEVASDLKFIPDKFEPYQSNHNCQNRKQSKYKHSNVCLVQIIVIILAITILGSMQILRISLVLPACMNMAHNINSLMDSQNYLLENYFEMKTYYLAYNFSKSVDQISQQIAVHLNQTEPRFTKVAKDSVDLFSGDPTFTKDFNDLLVVDSCKLTAFLFEPWQVYYCINNFTTPILSLGLVSGMTFFQRNAYNALSELLAKQHQNINKTAYFMQDVFTDIDDSIFYMFRLYQATQDRMYKGLRYIVNSSLFLLDTINAFSTLILVFVMFWWIKSYRTQQRQVSQLYGMVLQFPQTIMKTQLITRIKRQLEINH